MGLTKITWKVLHVFNISYSTFFIRFRLNSMSRFSMLSFMLTVAAARPRTVYSLCIYDAYVLAAL